MNEANSKSFTTEAHDKDNAISNKKMASPVFYFKNHLDCNIHTLTLSS